MKKSTSINNCAKRKNSSVNEIEETIEDAKKKKKKRSSVAEQNDGTRRQTVSNHVTFKEGIQWDCAQIDDGNHGMST